MKNKDILQQEKTAIMQSMAEAIRGDDESAFAKAFTGFAEHVQAQILGDAQEVLQRADTSILSARGVRQLTAQENQYYESVIGAMRAGNPKQALSELEVVIPKTTIDAVFEDLKAQHPLLDQIRFQNTSGLIELIVNTGTKQLATWSSLTAEIAKELTGGFKKTPMGQSKLSAFLPVAKAMLDLGPIWLDRYVREILQEALYLGLEEAILNGTGKDMPIGMNRQVGEGVTVTGGVYPEKTPTPLTKLDPVSYGALLSSMATTPNGNPRTVEGVLMLVNPTDYLTKIMPATTVRSADGTYASNVFPFPTTVIQSVQIPKNRAIIGLAERYFMGLGTAKSGKIEYSDEYRFLEDERVYLVKLYGHGEPLDNNAFVYADITNLTPVVQEVVVNEVKTVVKTKEQA